MCVVSYVSDYYTDPNRWTGGTASPIQAMDYTTLKLLQDALAKLDAIDKKIGDVNCMDDKKDQFIKELQERVATLEKQQDIKPERKEVEVALVVNVESSVPNKEVVEWIDEALDSHVMKKYIGRSGRPYVRSIGEIK